MRKNRKYFLSVLTVVALLTGCVSSISIPTTTRMSDAIMMGINTSPKQTVAFYYASQIQNGMIKPCNRGTREVQSSHPGYTHNENASLERMLRDYVSMKFTNLDDSSDTKIKVTLRDFWLEQYSTDSAGKIWLAALGGGEINVMVVANLDLVYEIFRGGQPVTKVVLVSGDSAHVAGIGTGTSTSYIHRGRESIEFRVAEAMNVANNKAIAMLNHFLEANEL